METQSQASISALVTSAIDDGQSLVKQQVELAKAEMSASAKRAGSASAMIAAAAVLAFLAFLFALVAGAYGIVAAGLPVWAGFLIVAGSLLLIGLILGMVGGSQAKKVSSRPERAIAQVEKTKAALSGGTAGPREVAGRSGAAATTR